MTNAGIRTAPLIASVFLGSLTALPATSAAQVPPARLEELLPEYLKDRGTGRQRGAWARGFHARPVTGVRLALVPDVDDVDGDGNRSERVPQRDAAGNPLFQPDRGDPSNINSARLPDFARLDARLTYRPSWSLERWAFYVDVMNVLSRKNVVLIDTALVLDPSSDRPRIIELSEEQGIPFFPSFGIRFWF